MWISVICKRTYNDITFVFPQFLWFECFIKHLNEKSKPFEFSELSRYTYLHFGTTQMKLFFHTIHNFCKNAQPSGAFRCIIQFHILRRPTLWYKAIWHTAEVNVKLQLGNKIGGNYFRRSNLYFLRPRISTNKLTFIQNENPKIPLPIGRGRIVLTYMIEFKYQSAVRVEIDKVLLVKYYKIHEQWH